MALRSDRATTGGLASTQLGMRGSPARLMTDPAALAARAETPSETYRELRTRGFCADEGGNLTAWLFGLPPVAGGWRPREIEALLFLRHLVGSDRADRGVHLAPAS